MHEIKLAENCSSDCFDSIAYSILKYRSLDYEAYNIKYFYTNYFCAENNCLIRGETDNDILKNIYNIDVISKGREESFDLSKNITQLIHKVPIGIFIDSYYCHWSPFYNNAHFTHCLLIVDVDRQNKKYLCFDVHYEKVGYVKIDIDLLLAHYESYFVFDFTNVKDIHIETLLDKIGSALNKYDGNIADKTQKMFNYFTTGNKSELFPEKLETSVPLVNLMWIAEDKKHFSIALNYIERKLQTNLFTPIYELLLESDKVFSILISLLIKYAMTGVIKEEKLGTIINRIFVVDDLINQHMKVILKELKSK